MFLRWLVTCFLVSASAWTYSQPRHRWLFSRYRCAPAYALLCSLTGYFCATVWITSLQKFWIPTDFSTSFEFLLFPLKYSCACVETALLLERKNSDFPLLQQDQLHTENAIVCPCRWESESQAGMHSRCLRGWRFPSGRSSNLQHPNCRECIHLWRLHFCCVLGSLLAFSCSSLIFREENSAIQWKTAVYVWGLRPTPSMVQLPTANY